MKNDLGKVKWGKFWLSDIFQEISRGKISDLRNISEGKTIIIAASGVFEGFSCFSDVKSIAHNAMTISFNGVGTGTAFVHNYPFNLNSDCGLVKPIKELSIETLRFIAVCINQNKSKFNYGYKANEKRILQQAILLPINDNEEPDYQFMEAYIKEKEMIKRKEYINYCNKQIKTIISGGGSQLIGNKQWKPFFITEIFTSIQRGRRLKSIDHIKGTIPYISSSSLNNGIDNFISNDKNVRKYNNCLSLANSGSVGSCFYEPFEFIASDHVTHLKNNDFNKYHYLFLATIINGLSQKYNFNREITDNRIAREKILLPVLDNDNNQPDYNYMENYIKNCIINKYIEYVEFVNNLITNKCLI